MLEEIESVKGGYDEHVERLRNNFQKLKKSYENLENFTNNKFSRVE